MATTCYCISPPPRPPAISAGVRKPASAARCRATAAGRAARRSPTSVARACTTAAAPPTCRRHDVNSRELALLFGIFYAGLGLLGLMPGNSALLGVLPDNLPLALLHLTMGAWALAAYFGHGSTQSYARSAAFILAALGLMG